MASKEMSIEEMVKKLQEDIKIVENFDDANGRLDIASMNKVSILYIIIIKNLINGVIFFIKNNKILIINILIANG